MHWFWWSWMAFVFIFNSSLPTWLLVQIQFRLQLKKTSKLHSILIFWEVGDPTVSHGFLPQRQSNARKDKTIYDVSISFSGLRYRRGKDIAYEASDVVSLILKIRPFLRVRRPPRVSPSLLMKLFAKWSECFMLPIFILGYLPNDLRRTLFVSSCVIRMIMHTPLHFVIKPMCCDIDLTLHCRWVFAKVTAPDFLVR